MRKSISDAMPKLLNPKYPPSSTSMTSPLTISLKRYTPSTAEIKRKITKRANTVKIGDIE
jgi:hypothetical protein